MLQALITVLGSTENIIILDGEKQNVDFSYQTQRDAQIFNFIRSTHLYMYLGISYSVRNEQ